MYIEVNVKSKQIDDDSNRRSNANTIPSQRSEISIGTKPPTQQERRIIKNKHEPETEEDKMLMDDFIRREEQYKT